MPGVIPYFSFDGWADNEMTIVRFGDQFTMQPAPADTFQALGVEPWTQPRASPTKIMVSDFIRVSIAPSVDIYLDPAGIVVGGTSYSTLIHTIDGVTINTPLEALRKSPSSYYQSVAQHPWLPNALVVYLIEPSYWAMTPRPGARTKWTLFETDQSAEHRITGIHAGFMPEIEWVLKDRERTTQ
jgi:hypothetical protein